MTDVNGGQLKAYIERIERVETDIDDLKSDVKEIYQEIKSTGFDCKIVRKIIRLRKKSLQERQEEEELISLYESSLGS